MKTLLFTLTAVALAGCCGPKYSETYPSTFKAVTPPPAEPLPQGDVMEPAFNQRTAPVATREIPAAELDVDSLELKKEDLSVRRATVSNGKVVIRKTVVSEQVNIPVTLSRDEYEVVEVPASGPINTPFGEGQAVLEVPLKRETAEAVITPSVYKRVQIKKTKASEDQTISGTVRTEKLEVIRQ